VNNLPCWGKNQTTSIPSYQHPLLPELFLESVNFFSFLAVKWLAQKRLKTKAHQWHKMVLLVVG
jgi:hypothetical protein